MSDPATTSTTPSLDGRARALAAVSIVAIVVALLQRTSFAPLPHGKDDFLAGFAVGTTIVSLGTMILARRR